jgi:hypothetical protein
MESLIFLPEAGIEPARCYAPRDFKSLASAYSATPANCYKEYFREGQVSREIISTGLMTGGRRKISKKNNGIKG